MFKLGTFAVFFLMLASLLYGEKTFKKKLFLNEYGISKISPKELEGYSAYELVVDTSYYYGGGGQYKVITFPEAEDFLMPQNVKFLSLGGNRAKFIRKENSLFLDVTYVPETDPELDLWVKLNPRAGKADASKDDLVINNGSVLAYLGKTGNTQLEGSPYLKCVRQDNGQSLVYAVEWLGNDLDGDGISDLVSFDVVLKGFRGAEVIRQLRKAKLKEEGDSVLVSEENAHWGIGDDGDLDAGEGIVCSIENVEVDSADYSSRIEVSIEGFKVGEESGERHEVVYGENKSPEKLVADIVGLSREYSSLNHKELLITSSGSGDDFGFLVENLEFHLKISPTHYEFVRSPTDYTHTRDGLRYTNSYPSQNDKVSFPEFSWDRVPKWIAIRSGLAYTEEAFESLANDYSVVLFEKQNKNAYLSQDLGTLKAAEALKRINPEVKVLTYWNSFLKYGTYSTLKPFNEEWYSGKMVRNVVKSYDLTNPDFRKWWVESALTLVESPNIDGIFIDSLRRHGGYFYDEDKTPTTETYQMLHDVRSRMPEEKMFVGNCLQFHLPNANRHLLECFDGAHTESWDEGSRRIPNGEERYSIADSIEASIQYISEATSKGKMVLLQSINFGEQGEEWDPEEDSKLSLAVFLMVVDQYCYYSFNRSVVAVFLENLEEKVEYMKSLGRPEEYVQKLIESQRKVSKNAAIISPEFLRAFNRPLGKPKGKYTKEGSLYTREFEHLKVTLDINTLETHFTWAEDADNDGLNDEWELDEYGSVFKKN